MHYILRLYNARGVQELNHNSASSGFPNICFLFLSPHFLHLGLPSYFLTAQHFHYNFIRKISFTRRNLEGSGDSFISPECSQSPTQLQLQYLLKLIIIYLIQFVIDCWGVRVGIQTCVSPQLSVHYNTEVGGLQNTSTIFQKNQVFSCIAIFLLLQGNELLLILNCFYLRNTSHTRWPTETKSAEHHSFVETLLPEDTKQEFWVSV